MFGKLLSGKQGNAVTESDVLDAIHAGRQITSHVEIRNDEQSEAVQVEGEAFPIPTPDVRVGTDSPESYLKRSRKIGSDLQQLMRKHGFQFEDGSRILDWGCSSGRVIRSFAEYAERLEIWGVDQVEKTIIWNKRHLSPPFHFVTGTALPHLAFEDGYFDVVFGISVFTHISRLIDSWLMELRRIMKSGGIGVFTIHNEASVQFWRRSGKLPFWIKEPIDLDLLERSDCTVFHGDDWGHIFTIFHSDWVRRECGRYFDVLDIVPTFTGSQAAVVVRKK